MFGLATFAIYPPEFYTVLRGTMSSLAWAVSGQKGYFQLMVCVRSYEALFLSTNIRSPPVDLSPHIKASLYVIINIVTDTVTDVNTLKPHKY